MTLTLAGLDRYYDREQNVGYEVRAGLSSVYATKGWVANDVHSEAASRTLDYACASSPFPRSPFLSSHPPTFPAET